MTRRKIERLTPLELETMLNILHRKGKVKRALKDRAYFYRPAVSRSQVVRQAVSDLVEHLFGGSVESLVMSLVETKHLDAEKLTRLNRLVKKSEEERDE